MSAILLATVLTFRDVLARVEGVGQTFLSGQTRMSGPHLPPLHAEMTLSNNGTLVSIDYPFFTSRKFDQQMAQLDEAAFHARRDDEAAARYREAVEAVASLYAAQERLRILNEGLKRSVSLRDRAKQLLASNEISNATAAQWEDESIAAQSQLLGLQLQRLDAETRVKQLMGDASSDSLEIELDTTAPPPQTNNTIATQRAQLALQQAEAARRPQLSASAFGGVAALSDNYFFNDRRRYGLYGVRLSIALPSFDSSLRVAEAQRNAEEAEIAKRNFEDAQRMQRAMLQLNLAAQQKRIDLLQQALDVAKEREESVVRLVAAGVRSESQAAEVAAERTRRESDLAGARVEVWRLQQLLAAVP